MKTKEEYDNEIENQAKLYLEKVFKGETIEGNTYLEKLTNKAISITNSTYNRISDKEKLDFGFNLIQNTFIKDKKLFTRLFLGGNIQVEIETNRLGKEINEFLQES